jgi:hypothetical protein
MQSLLASRFSRSSIARQTHSAIPLTEDELHRLTPSVFAETAHESRSRRYAYIPTIEVLRGLASNGFKPFYAVQAKCRSEGKTPYTKHMLRLRHEDQIQQRGEDVNEVILINSHDGTSSYQMLAGVFRFVCANGMVCGTTSADIRVKHGGNAVHDVVEGAVTVLDGFQEVDASKDAFKSLQLTSGEQSAFANAAIALRFGTEREPPVQATEVIQARRYEDRSDSLWATFQRAQENLVQGGLRTNNQQRRTRTRGVNGIDGNVALNRGLWVLAEEMRRMKTA